MSKRLSDQQGFSLVELITSLIIITILAVGLSGTTSYAKQIEIRNRQRVQAGSILEQELMRLRQTGPRNLTVGTTTRPTTEAVEGVDGVLTTEIIADATYSQDKFLRLRIDWDNRSQALATFLFQE